MAANPRTVQKATIKRASAIARRDMDQLDARALDDLTEIYQQAIADLQTQIRDYAGTDGNLRLETMRELEAQAQQRLNQLSAARDQLLDNNMISAAQLGIQPYAGQTAIIGTSLAQVSNEAVQFVRTFVAEDGLQLSDRLWRLDNHAKEIVARSIESAVIQGHSASRAAQDFLARGAPVPVDIASKMNMARADGVARVVGTELMRPDDGPYANALRLFRTEINRAHGEAYRTAAAAVPDAIGTRFLLSPNHPRVDICDMHAAANLYGLGPGVYPFGKSPLPAHPNTLSYEEIVFRDEITDEDRDGKEDEISWLKSQNATVQIGVLGKHKQAALAAGTLKKNEINTPWRVLKTKYEKQGTDIAGTEQA